MVTCFIFVNSTPENSHYLSLSLNEQARVVAPLAVRDPEAIKAIQKNCNTIIVLSSLFSSLHKVSLPWLADKKARLALPFALEDKLAQNLDLLHIAFSQDHYHDDHYLVVVVDKSFLVDLIANLKLQEINFNCITIDWFALNHAEIAVLDNYLLINNQHLQAVLAVDLVNYYINSLSSNNLPATTKLNDNEHNPIEPININYFINSNELILTRLMNLAKEREFTTSAIKSQAQQWIAMRLQQLKPINLCQGALQQKEKQGVIKRWYQAAIVISCIWLIGFISINASKLYLLKHELNTMDAQISVVYHKFFPQATQVISPKFRINQWLKTNQNNEDYVFWIILNAFAKNFQSNLMQIKHIHYHNQIITLTLITPGFEELEILQNQLIKESIKVKQTQATMEENRVIGKLELNL